MAGRIGVDPDDTPYVSRVDVAAHTGMADPGMTTERGRSVIMVMSPTWSGGLSCRGQRASLGRALRIRGLVLRPVGFPPSARRH